MGPDPKLSSSRMSFHAAIWVIKDRVPGRGVGFPSHCHFGIGMSRSCARYSREHDDGIVADGSHGFKRHIAGALDSPFVTLFHEDGADQARYRGLIGEDADDLGAALDLAVRPLDRIRAV